MLSVQLTTLALFSAAHAANHEVVLGPDFNYHPNSVTAETGDTVSFRIGQLHNVQQSEFNNPCQNLPGGFSSGPAFSGADFNPELFIIEINNTDPIFAYCGAPLHCQTGMTFGINVPESGDQTLAAYNSAAADTESSQNNPNIQGGIFSTTVPSDSSSDQSSSAAPSESTTAPTGESSSAAGESSSPAAGVAPEATPTGPSNVAANGSATTTGAFSGSTGSSFISNNSASTSVYLFSGSGTKFNSGGAISSFVLAVAGAFAYLI